MKKGNFMRKEEMGKHIFLENIAHHFCFYVWEHWKSHVADAGLRGRMLHFICLATAAGAA